MSKIGLNTTIQIGLVLTLVVAAIMCGRYMERTDRAVSDVRRLEGLVGYCVRAIVRLEIRGGHAAGRGTRPVEPRGV